MMESTWPIALGLIGLGIVIAFVWHYAKEQERSQNLRLQALDLALNPEQRDRPAFMDTERAQAYLDWLQGPAPAPIPEKSTKDIIADFREVSHA